MLRELLRRDVIRVPARKAKEGMIVDRPGGGLMVVVALEPRDASRGVVPRGVIASGRIALEDMNLGRSW